MNVIVNEKLHNQKFVDEHTENFAAFAAEISKYTPEYVEPITGVLADDIRRAARLFATSERSIHNSQLVPNCY